MLNVSDDLSLQWPMIPNCSYNFKCIRLKIEVYWLDLSLIGLIASSELDSSFPLFLIHGWMYQHPVGCVKVNKNSWTCQSSLKLEEWLEKDFFKISPFLLVLNRCITLASFSRRKSFLFPFCILFYFLSFLQANGWKIARFFC